MNMQANYPKKLQPTYWDPVKISYPVRKGPTTEVSSETTGRVWQTPNEVLPALAQKLLDRFQNFFYHYLEGFFRIRIGYILSRKIDRIFRGSENCGSVPVYEERQYLRDYRVTDDLLRSQSSLDFGYKISETTRFNKHTACNENQYIYPPGRKLMDRNPTLSAHGTTETKNSFTVPTVASRLVTNKDQFKHPSTLLLDQSDIEPHFKELEPLDTRHDGFEKYLDPYLTTSRLHHRPFTVDQLHKQSNSKDVLTYYTYSDIPWVRSPKPNIENWHLSVSKARSMYDREKFKDEFREIRTHKRPKWIPRAFRTENLDNYITFNQTGSQIHNYEEEVRSLYQRSLANLQTKSQENVTKYTTENSQIGLRKPICVVLDQYAEKNKRL